MRVSRRASEPKPGCPPCMSADALFSLCVKVSLHLGPKTNPELTWLALAVSQKVGTLRCGLWLFVLCGDELIKAVIQLLSKRFSISLSMAGC